MAEAPKSALVVVDMLNSYEHDDAEPLTKSVETIIDPVTKLIGRAQDEGVEIIYVNDNYGDWNSSSEELAQRALDGTRPDLVEPILPPEGADFVIKARHTIFYMTRSSTCSARRRSAISCSRARSPSSASSTARSTRTCATGGSRCRATAWPCIHEKLADAALEMMERNMDAEITSCADVKLSAAA